jgi:hypothetical protein
MLKELEITHTVDRLGKPLIIVETMMGNGLDAYPEQLRALAAALCKAANDADARNQTARRNLSRVKIRYPLIFEKTQQP